jgi:protein gp37
VQDRRHGLPRIDHLRAAPARRRFLSVEPLLEDLGTICLDNIDWVIVGGESGPGARPMEPAWVRDIREQCRAATVPFFLKQSGTLKNHPDRTDPTAKQNGGNAKGGRMLDGRTWDEMPALTAPDLPERHSTTARPSTTSADSRIAARNQPGRLLSAPEAQS